MTIVRVRFTPPGGPVPGFIRARPQHDVDNRPLVVGADILNGDTGWIPVSAEGEDIELRPTEPGWHYAIQGKAEGAPSFSVTKLVPPTGPVDFGDLVSYNPKAGMAYEPDPPWYAHLSSIEAGVEGTQADLRVAMSEAEGFAALADESRGHAGTHAANAQTAASQAQTARDQTVALGVTVDTSAGTKVSVGGVVVHYDSGWRNVSPVSGWALGTNGLLRVRRIGDRVTLFMVNVDPAQATGTTFYVPPQGFRSVAPAQRRLSALRGDSGISTTFTLHPNYVRVPSVNIGTLADEFSGISIDWLTNDAIPNTLPGTPA